MVQRGVLCTAQVRLVLQSSSQAPLVSDKPVLEGSSALRWGVF